MEELKNMQEISEKFFAHPAFNTDDKLKRLCNDRIDLLIQEGKVAEKRRHVEKEITLLHLERLNTGEA